MGCFYYCALLVITHSFDEASDDVADGADGRHSKLWIKNALPEFSRTPDGWIEWDFTKEFHPARVAHCLGASFRRGEDIGAHHELARERCVVLR